MPSKPDKVRVGQCWRDAAWIDDPLLEGGFFTVIERHKSSFNGSTVFTIKWEWFNNDEGNDPTNHDVDEEFILCDQYITKQQYRRLVMLGRAGVNLDSSEIRAPNPKLTVSVRKTRSSRRK